VLTEEKTMSLPQEIVGLIILAGVVGAFGMFCAMKALGYARWATGHSDGWEEELYQKQKKRVLSIKSWASTKIDAIPTRCQRPDYHVLVTHQELINIWDKCDRIADDLV